ncbi:BA75_03988T0 [Komagataella pastoris]|uniref:BA75_03988T0 n=1 Tax=Komagataella pastoris TaxID=4922 RepID=A0A1B2JFQ8_PICPA|nr:BA75_03988T0 [Komagataella pastoris]
MTTRRLPRPISKREQEIYKLGPPRNTKPGAANLELDRYEQNCNRKLVDEYLNDVLQYHAALEELDPVNARMIDLQPEISWYMRPYLISFLIEVHLSYRLKASTLFLCVNLIDRYCSRRIVFKQHYQLVGCTALWIAAKYEDKKSRVPLLKDLVLMTQNSFDESMFKEMELHMLSTLDWQIGHVSLEESLQSIMLCFEIDSLTVSHHVTGDHKAIRSALVAISRYLCELSLYHRSFICVSPNVIATTATLISCTVLEISNGTEFVHDLVQDIIRDKQQPENYDIDDMDDIFFSENEDELNDENEPSYNSRALCPPFVTSFDGDQTLRVMKLVALLFLTCMLDPPDVLVDKYKPLGVIDVLSGYLSTKQDHIQNQMDMLDPSKLDFEASEKTYLLLRETNPQLLQTAEWLLSITEIKSSTSFQLPHTPTQEESSESLYRDTIYSLPKYPDTTNYTAKSSRDTLMLSSSPSMPPLTPPSVASTHFSSSSMRSPSHVVSYENNPAKKHVITYPSSSPIFN